MSFELLLNTRELGSTHFAKVLELHSRTYGYVAEGYHAFRSLRYKTVALAFLDQLDERLQICIPHPYDTLTVKRPETIPFLVFENSTAIKKPEQERCFNERIEQYFRNKGLGHYLFLPEDVLREKAYSKSDFCTLSDALRQRTATNSTNF